MKLYIDSARVSVIESFMKTGVFHGVTTNPHLLKEAGVPPERLSELARQVFDLGAGEVFFQSWGEDAAALHLRGRQLADLDDRVVVKLPATLEGFEAASMLAAAGTRTCITAVFAAFQGILAAGAGAAYVAPYLGRMNDAGRDGHAVIALMSGALRRVESPTAILAASVRTVDDVALLAQNGVRCITLSPAVARNLFREPLTLEAVRSFETAANAIE
ncbi:MAG TPA: transaldolase family protein [Syntrophobacteraceae bacterium]|nr:transaldolase family protein [Syntrophobacteraceae bacterium]